MFQAYNNSLCQTTNLVSPSLRYSVDTYYSEFRMISPVFSGSLCKRTDCKCKCHNLLLTPRLKSRPTRAEILDIDDTGHRTPDRLAAKGATSIFPRPATSLLYALDVGVNTAITTTSATDIPNVTPAAAPHLFITTILALAVSPAHNNITTNNNGFTYDKYTISSPLALTMDGRVWNLLDCARNVPVMICQKKHKNQGRKIVSVSQ